MAEYTPRRLKSGRIKADQLKATGAKTGVIALKRKYTAAAAALRSEIRGLPEVRLHLMESIYPAGDEFIVVYEVTGKVIPPGEIPLKAGVLVSNVETFRNISRAQRGRPVISRHLTVTGAVRDPKTVSLPLGTPVRDALELAGGPVIEDWVTVIGGPMMGEVNYSSDTPITKTTSALIVLPADHPVVTRKTRSLEFDLAKIRSICCQCDYCTLVCPRALLGHNFKPHLVMRSLALGIPFPESPGLTGAAMCTNCDLCGVYSCPMNLPIGRLNNQVAAGMGEWHWKATARLPGYSASPRREYSLIPVSRLTSRLRLTAYDRDAPLDERPFAPAAVTIPLKQHLGAASRAVVKKNQKVAAGEVIGEIPRGVMGARVHASISGIVKQVNSESITILAS
jgi:Na+-translocating ferredoxin:NAD+ oxidoreductase RnfC subunit